MLFYKTSAQFFVYFGVPNRYHIFLTARPENMFWAQYILWRHQGRLQYVIPHCHAMLQDITLCTMTSSRIHKFLGDISGLLCGQLMWKSSLTFIPGRLCDHTQSVNYAQFLFAFFPSPTRQETQDEKNLTMFIRVRT